MVRYCSRDGAAQESRVYALESCKNVTVVVKMSHENVGYSLRRIPRGGVEQVQFLELLASMEGAALVDMRDRWVWSLEGSGEFFVASVRRLIDEHWLPLNISRRGMNIESILCPICDKAVKSASHIFFACHIAIKVFHKITSWWDVNFMELSSYEERLEWLLNLRHHTKYKKLLE
ncbi:hypothetical protein Tco_0891275 [Tanacetum coccineum]|uniref:Reverse transcriptase zinc-binding domain-containing protein n=1 Tax=Tanacetum coccineum TaxID=301880 RepID=A0ABQ5C3Z7_9ASTR